MMGLKLGEECLLGLGLLGQGFDYQIGIGNRCGQVGFIVEVFKGFVGLTEQSVIVCGGGIPVEDQPTAYGTAMLLCGGQLCLINLVESRHLGLGALDGCLAAEIGGHVEARIGALIGDLAAQYTAASYGYVLNFHDVSSILPGGMRSFRHNNLRRFGEFGRGVGPIPFSLYDFIIAEYIQKPLCEMLKNK